MNRAPGIGCRVSRAEAPAFRASCSPLRRFRRLAAGALAAVAIAALPAMARAADPGDRTEAVPPQLQGVDIEPRPGAQVPLDLVFNDEEGRSVRLGDYFQAGRPVILNLLYFRCPSICSPLLQSLIASLGELPSEWSVGRKFDVLTVSFDPLETPALAKAKKKSMLEAYARPGAAPGWHVLTGQEANIKALTDAVGFTYKWDAETNQFAHGVGIIILSPEGKATHYLRTVTFDPRTLRLAMTEASEGRVGTLSDKVALLTCFRFDPDSGTYTVAAVKLVRSVGVASVLLLGCLVGGAMFVGAKRRHRLEAGQQAGAARTHA